MTKEAYIKIILSILLFGALLDLQYGYYQVLRIVCFIGFWYLAFLERNNSNQFWLWIWIISSILFNPIAKIIFSRDVWNGIDLVLGVLLWVSVFTTLLTKGKDLSTK